MVNTFITIVKSSRPIQGIKNLALFAALIFSGQLFEPKPLMLVVFGFVTFSFITSATYIFNDVIDRKNDRVHPLKKNRPIAKGSLDIPTALTSVVVLTFLALYFSWKTSPAFFWAIVAFAGLQISYSLLLKNIVVFDILAISLGYILRVYAGAFLIDAHLSVWFLLCVISMSLFLASGKRRAELNRVADGVTRKTLSVYTPDLLDSYLAMFANSSWLSWALFTFFESPHIGTPIWLFLAEISKTTTISKLLMITIPVAIFGIMRYLRVVYEGNRAEIPEKVLLTDKPLIGAIFVWLFLVVGIIYFI